GAGRSVRHDRSRGSFRRVGCVAAADRYGTQRKNEQTNKVFHHATPRSLRGRTSAPLQRAFPRDLPCFAEARGGFVGNLQEIRMQGGSTMVAPALGYPALPNGAAA